MTDCALDMTSCPVLKYDVIKLCANGCTLDAFLYHSTGWKWNLITLPTAGRRNFTFVQYSIIFPFLQPLDSQEQNYTTLMISYRNQRLSSAYNTIWLQHDRLQLTLLQVKCIDHYSYIHNRIIFEGITEH